MIQNQFFLTISIKYTGVGMWQIEQFEQRRLFNFVLNALIGVVTWKGRLTHSIKEVCIKSRRVINFVCLADEFGFPGAVIGKI